MNKLRLYGIAAIFAMLLSLLAPTSAVFANNGDIGSGEFCHVPQGHPESATTKNESFQGHFELVDGQLVGRHGGDYMGPCNNDPGPTDPGPQPAAVVVYGDWSTEQATCEVQSVTQSRSVTTTEYVLSTDGTQWVLGTPVVTTETRTDTLTAEELAACQPTEPVEVRICYTQNLDPEKVVQEAVFASAEEAEAAGWVFDGEAWHAGPGLTRAYTAVPCDAPTDPGPQPAAVVVYGDWSTEQATCEVQSVTQSRSVTTTEYVLSTDGTQWVLGTPVVTTETRTDTLTAEELAACQPTEPVEVPWCLVDESGETPMKSTIAELRADGKIRVSANGNAYVFVDGKSYFGQCDGRSENPSPSPTTTPTPSETPVTPAPTEVPSTETPVATEVPTQASPTETPATVEPTQAPPTSGTGTTGGGDTTGSAGASVDVLPVTGTGSAVLAATTWWQGILNGVNPLIVMAMSLVAAAGWLKMNFATLSSRLRRKA